MPGVTDIVSAVIPCLGEEDAIGAVVASVVAQGVAEVIVVDGASRDRTVERATAAGHGLSSNRGVACRAETKAPNSPSKSDRLLAETKCTHESPPVRGYSQ
jgi:cellulose synthase/poly-beta-1,6-N-acetylglucosamine synthase-like glycosyltransferase